MFTELKKKKLVFDSFKPFSDEFITAYDNLNLLDLAYMNLKLDGSNLTKEGVNEISKGGMVNHVSLMEHQQVEYHRQIFKTFNDMIEMRMDLDEQQLIRLYMVLTNNDDLFFRKSGTMLYHLDYMPPHASDIESSLRNIFVRAFKTDFGDDFVRKAVFIHNKIIEVYPFEEKSEALARVALQYELIRNDFPVIPFDLSESQYNSMIADYLKSGEYDNLYENILISGAKKMDVLLELLREEDMNKV